MLFFALLGEGKGYLQHDGKSLEGTQMVRLLVLGAKLQADDAMAQCRKELGATPMQLATALGLTEVVPAEMDAYFEVKALREQAWTTVVQHVEVSDAYDVLIDLK
jgi:hypothetical protein